MKRQLTLWSDKPPANEALAYGESVQESTAVADAVAQRISEQSQFTSIKAVTVNRIGSLEGRPKITSTKAAVTYFKSYWQANPANDQEHFVIACLDTKHVPLAVYKITTGTLDASLVHPREVFKPTIVEGASAIILSHNHPSGDPTPSREDHQVTNQLTDAGRLIGINVLDHIIYGCGTDEAVSIRES